MATLSTTVENQPRACRRGLSWPRGSQWSIVAALTITALVSLPQLLVGLLTPPDAHFQGQIWSPHDLSQYLAAMREGASGAWLIHDHLSSEPHAPALIYPFYVLLGRGAAAVDIGFED